jgi:hypothetical protein
MISIKHILAFTLIVMLVNTTVNAIPRITNEDVMNSNDSLDSTGMPQIRPAYRHWKYRY